MVSVTESGGKVSRWEGRSCKKIGKNEDREKTH